MRVIDKIALIDTQNGKVLSARSKGKDKFYLPGGKREPGETDEQCLVREIAEELNVQIDPNSMVYMDTFTAQADSHKEGVMVKMTCYRARYSGTLTPSREIEEIRWLTFKDLDIISAVDKIIFAYLKERGELV